MRGGQGWGLGGTITVAAMFQESHAVCTLRVFLQRVLNLAAAAVLPKAAPAAPPCSSHASPSPSPLRACAANDVCGGEIRPGLRPPQRDLLARPSLSLSSLLSLSLFSSLSLSLLSLSSLSLCLSLSLLRALSLLSLSSLSPSLPPSALLSPISVRNGRRCAAGQVCARGCAWRRGRRAAVGGRRQGDARRARSRQLCRLRPAAGRPRRAHEQVRVDCGRTGPDVSQD